MTTELASLAKIMGAHGANDTRVTQQLGQSVNAWVSETVMPSRHRSN
jgi:hypothetical protein